MRTAAMKVGELAKQTGVSIRKLHYYDEIGLLKPSSHTEAGYRLYTAGDIARLQQIKSLQQLGFSLEEIRECLDRPDFSPYRVIQLHMERLREQMELAHRLYNRLEAIANGLQKAETVSVEEFIDTIEVMQMFEKYYTPEQGEYLKERANMLGEEQIRQVEAEWKELIEQVRAEMQKGTDPASESVQLLAKRWKGLIDEFTGGNPEIEKSLNAMYQQEGPEIASRGAVDSEMFEYISRVMAASKKSE